MKITIIGGGNIGTQFAVHYAEAGHEVTMFTSKPDQFQQTLTIVGSNDETIHSAKISQATASPNIAFKDAELIFVTVPSFAMKETAAKILPFVSKGMMIGIIPGNGGGEIAFSQALKKGAILFGLQRVPSVARLVKYGAIVKATGYRNKLFVSALPKKFTSKCAQIVEDGIGIECGELPEYLNLTLTPSNPILHTTRLYTLFKDYKQGKVYERVPLFYQEWNDETTKLLFACDEEVQALCSKLTDFDLSEVRSLKEHYENDTVEGFTHKIQSIVGFRGLLTPMVKTGSGYIPDLNSRYFTADFNFGLNVILQTASLFGIEMKNCSKIMNWYKEIAVVTKEFSFESNGITDVAVFDNFYKQ